MKDQEPPVLAAELVELLALTDELEVDVVACVVVVAAVVGVVVVALEDFVAVDVLVEVPVVAAVVGVVDDAVLLVLTELVVFALHVVACEPIMPTRPASPTVAMRPTAIVEV